MRYKPFLILQLRPEDVVSDNEFESILKYGRLKSRQVKRVRVEKAGIPKLKLNQFSGIIVGGSPFDVSKPENQKSDIQKTIEKDFNILLKKVINKDYPFLGICSGCGLLGKYCGTKISSLYGEPVSGVDIRLTKEGKKDPLLKNMPDRFRALVGHKEACDSLPPGAVLLATTSLCPVQMFRIGQNVYSTQFHPEANTEVFKVRIHAYKNHGYFSPNEAKKLIAEIDKEDISTVHEILDRFVARYLKSAN